MDHLQACGRGLAWQKISLVYRKNKPYIPIVCPHSRHPIPHLSHRLPYQENSFKSVKTVNESSRSKGRQQNPRQES